MCLLVDRRWYNSTNDATNIACHHHAVDVATHRYYSRLAAIYRYKYLVRTMIHIDIGVHVKTTVTFVKLQTNSALPDVLQELITLPDIFVGGGGGGGEYFSPPNFEMWGAIAP